MLADAPVRISPAVFVPTGCQYAKIQKRNPDVCVPEAQKSKMRDTPWGRMTYIEYKYKMKHVALL